MIKRIVFEAAGAQRALETVVEAWSSALAGWRDAPAAQRPARVVSCEVLHDERHCDERFDVVEQIWCNDADHLTRCTAWANESGLYRPVEAILDPARTCTMFADESVGRGADWLERRWADDGVAYKHMAVAHRADGLSPAEFSSLWRSRAGTVKKSGSSVAIDIPTAVRGLAYVQNHRAPDVGISDVDAVNEVYFDDRAGLRLRIEWFAEHLADGEDDLVGEHWFHAVAETVVVHRTTISKSPTRRSQ